MFIRRCLITECPHCKGEKELMQLLSRNISGVEIWSDARAIAPMYPELSPIQKCPHCGHYFMLSLARKKRGNRESMECGWLSFEEALEATKEFKRLPIDDYGVLLLTVVWAYNDIIRNGGTPTVEQFEKLKDYLSRELELPEVIDDENLLGELYREIGLFDRSIKELHFHSRGKFDTATILQIAKYNTLRINKVFLTHLGADSFSRFELGNIMMNLSDEYGSYSDYNPYNDNCRIFMMYSNIYNRFIDNIRNNYHKFNRFDDVNFLLEPFKEIRLQEGYVLDAYKVMDVYYRTGEYFMQLYTCKEGSDIKFVPRLVDVRDTLLKKLRLQKCEQKYVPDFDSTMYIAHPIPIALMDSIPCENLIVPFTETAIWEALMLKIAYMLLPKFGHGNYMDSKLIIDTDSLENVIEEHKIAKIENGVVIQGDTAIVKYTYWNDWQGLVKITLKAIKNGNTIKWDNAFEKEIIDPHTSSMRF